MRCWSCGKEIADDAQRCSHCEAMVDASPDFEEMEMAREFIDNLDPEMRKRLYEVFEDSSTGEEFVDRIMVGNCPQCDSAKTGNCEHDPDIEDVSIGRCFDCGYLWCTICDSPYTPGVACAVCQELEDEFDDELDSSLDEPVALNRYHLLAAEMFGYSFANYQNHLGIGHERYEELMPHAVQQVEQAVQEGWSLSHAGQEAVSRRRTLRGRSPAIYRRLQKSLSGGGCREPGGSVSQRGAGLYSVRGSGGVAR